MLLLLISINYFNKKPKLIFLSDIRLRRTKNIHVYSIKKKIGKPNFLKDYIIKLESLLWRIVSYMLILINEIEKRAKIIFLSLWSVLTCIDGVKCVILPHAPC